ncbi:hypothetical protein J1N35_010838, partial [Gossypium stocksii]
IAREMQLMRTNVKLVQSERTNSTRTLTKLEDQISQLMSMIGDIKRQIGSSIPSNTEYNPWKEEVTRDNIDEPQDNSLEVEDETEPNEENAPAAEMGNKTSKDAKITKDHESRNIERHIWDIVLVQGKEVRVIPRIICEFYNAPYYENDFINETDLEYFKDLDMDSIINFLTESRDEWKYRKEFARQNNIRVLNYTPNMFGPTNMEQDKEAKESEEEGEKDEDNENEEMDDEEDD